MQYKYYEYMRILQIKYHIMYAYQYFIDEVMDRVFICIMNFSKTYHNILLYRMQTLLFHVISNFI